MSDTRITAFLDQERTFDLAPQMLELERITGAGVGRVVARVISGEFHAADLAAVVRLSLIGGGETPKDAAALVATYVTGRPLSEAHALATTIVMALWAGKPKAATPEEAKAPDQLVVVHPGGREEILWTEGAD